MSAWSANTCPLHAYYTNESIILNENRGPGYCTAGELRGRVYMNASKYPGCVEGSQPFDRKSETSDMRGGFGTLQSKDSLHRALTVSNANKGEMKNRSS